jgi:hypothetical protein
MDDARADRIAFVREHRWGLAFAAAIGLTFLTLPMRPAGAGLAYDLIPAAALGAVWLAAGVMLGALTTVWSRPRTAALPTARTRR